MTFLSTKSRFFVTCVSVTALAIGFSASPAHAAGFYIQESSVSGLGYAFAGSTTSINDASTIYFNPAGMTELDGMQANVGVNLLIPYTKLKDTGTTIGGAPVSGGDGGNPYKPTPVPNAFFAAPVMGDDLWVGVGVSAPFGLGSDYGDTWFGRYDSTKTKLTTINIQPSVAYKINDHLSIGGGVDVQYADAELKSALNIAGNEGRTTLKGDDWTVGYNLGVTIRPTSQTTIGAHYRSAITHRLSGRFKIEDTIPAADVDTGGTARLKLPDIATFGIAQDLNDQWRVMAQATWFGWSNFDEIAPVRADGVDVDPIEQNYKNTWAFAIGAEYDLNKDWTIRAGYQYDPTPTRDNARTSRTPDGDRNWITAGATYHWSDRVSVDLAGAFIHVGSGNIDLTRNFGGNVDMNAKSKGKVGIVAAAVNYRF